MKKKWLLYLFTGIGATAAVLLRLRDRIDALSVILSVAALTGLLYGARRAKGVKEHFIVAGITVTAFEVRLWGTIAVPYTDIAIGMAVGLIMFGLLSAERLLKKYEDRPWYTLVFPVVYLLFMYLSEVFRINMPFRFDVYLSCSPVLCGVTSLCGIYFLEFLLGWTASVIVYVATYGLSRKSILTAVSCVVLIGAVLVYGAIHERQMNDRESEKTDTVKVAYTTGPFAGRMTDGEFADISLEENLSSLSGSVETAAKEQAEILMFCEEAFGIRDQDEAVLIGAAQTAARDDHMHILLAYEINDTDDSEGGRSVNKLCWITDEGETIYEYTKYCHVPIVETLDYVRGDGDVSAIDIMVHGRQLKVATGICYDCDFDSFMSRFEEDIDLLFIPTWDWETITQEHFGVARLRAIADETTLIRSVYDGWSAVIDSAGNVLKLTDVNETGYGVVQFCNVPVK